MEAKSNEAVIEADRLLSDALHKGDMRRVEEAISKGADMNRYGYKLLSFLMRRGRTELADKMIYLASKQNLNSFAMEACVSRDAEVLKKLKKSGAILRINAQFVKEHQGAVAWLSVTGIKATILFNAFEYVQTKRKMCPELLNQLLIVMKVSEETRTYQYKLDFLTHESAKCGNLELVKFYESRGGTVKNILPMDIESIKKSGHSVILYYLRNKNVNVGKLI